MASETGKDPTPAYHRGLWFDGMDCLEVTDVVFHHTFTLRFWIRVAKDGNIFSINKSAAAVPDEENVFNVQAVGGKIRIVLVDDEGVVDFQTDTAYTTDDWAVIFVCVQWNDTNEESTISVRNSEALIAESTFIGAFIDDSTYTHLLGVEKNVSGANLVDSGFYTGFIWEFCLSAIYVANADNQIGEDCSTTNPGLCVICPPEPCLIDCEVDFWLDEEGCNDCLTSCDTCVNDQNCELCFDLECADCPEWETCNACVENASFVGEGEDQDCECNENFFYDPLNAACTQCYSGC